MGDFLTAPPPDLTVADVLITEELKRRPAREADIVAENRALHALAARAADAPEAMLNALVRAGLELCHAGTAGVSLLERGPGGGEVFRWAALAGRLEHHVDGTTPRDWSLSGTCLDRGGPQLYRYPARYFTYLNDVSAPIVEALVIPFALAGESLGTIWVVSHEETRSFDGEDVRVMTALADFTAAAVRAATAERDLRTSVERLQRGIEMAPTLVVGVDDNGRIALFNRACEALTGYARDEILQHELLPLLVPAAWHAAVAARLGDERPEVRSRPSRSPWLTKSGDERLIEWRWFRESTLTIGLGSDVTAQVLAEDERRKLIALVEHSDDFIALASPDGRLVYLNPAGQQLVGLDSVDQIAGTNILDYVGADEIPRLRRVVPPALEAQGRWEGETVFPDRTTGGLIPVELRTFLVRDPDNQVITLAHVGRNLTERKKSEHARSILASIVQSSDDAIIGKTLEGLVTSWNPGAERMYGFAAAEMVGRPINIVVPPGRRYELLDIMDLLARGECIRDYETTRLKKNGETIHVSLSISPIYDGRGALVGASTIARDITERKRSEARVIAQHAITRALVEAESAAEVGAAVLEALCPVLGWDVAEFWLVDEPAAELRCVAMSARPELDTRPFQAATVRRTFRCGVGLPGLVWQHTKPEWIADLATDESFLRRDAAVAAGLRSAMAFPVTAGSRTLGVIVALTCRRWEWDDGVRQLMNTIGGQIGLFIERKRAEEELRHREDVFRSLSTCSPVGICLTDVDGRNTYTNPRCEEIFGVAAEQIRGDGWVDVVYPPDRKRVLDSWRACVRDGREFDGELRVQRPDGGVRWVHGRAAPVRSATGRRLGYVGTVEDVTEQRRADAKVAAEKNLLELIARAEPLPAVLDAMLRSFEEEQPGVLASVLLLDEEGTHLVSAAGPSLPAEWVRAITPLKIGPTAGSCGTAAYRRQPVIVADLATDALWANFRDLALRMGLRACWSIPILGGQNRLLGTFAMYYREPRVPTTEELRLVEGHAHLARLAIERHALEAERGRLVIREQAARVEAERVNQAKDEFLSVLSHELRTPLNAIVGWAAVMSRGPLDSEKMATATSAIGRSAQALNRLIGDLLDVSRIVAGKFELTRTAVDLMAVTGTAIDSVRFIATSVDIAFEVVSPDQPVVVLGDAAKLQQVVVNLLTNAVKVSPRGGRVGVRVESAAAEVRVTVTDEGVGISPDFLSRIFERFTQDPARTRAHSGLGLGLAIVKHIVELHGGSVGAASPGVGQGATFSVTLPRLHVAPSGEPTSEPAAPEDSPDVALRGVRVLVVEDEPDTRELLATVTRRSGAVVKEVASARAALEAVAEFDPQLVISDIRMGGMDGYELIRELRRQAQRVPAVALTAFASAADKEAAKAAGFELHLAKPIDPDELVSALSRLIGRRAA